MYVEIIDDNTQLANYVRKSFEKRWSTVEVYNSRDSFLHESKFNADLFLMDINLWDWNWLDMIEHLRVLEKVTAPIIIVSGQSSSNVRREWLQLGANGFIEKPFSAWELHEEIDTILALVKEWKHKTINSCLSDKEKSKLFKK